MPNRRIYLPAPLPHQLQFLGSDARYKVVCCGRRWGKTKAGLLAVVEGHGPPGCHRGAIEGANIWWVAPTYPIASLIWRDLKHALADAWKDKSEVERRIDLDSGGSISVRSADRPDGLRGAGLDGVVIDEAAFCREETWTEALRPALADRQGWAVFISTPDGDNWFRGLFDRAADAEGWARWQRPTSDNPIIPPEELAGARLELGGHAYAQEFEAQFVTAGGGLFSRDWMRYYRSHAEDVMLGNRLVSVSGMRRFATVDLAASTKTTADYTVIASWGATPDGDLVLLDLDRARREGPDIIPAIHRAVARHRLAVVAIERVGFQLALVQAARREGLPVRELTPDRDKVARALPATAAMEAGRVWFPERAHYLADLEAELLSFPAGAHDDQVDALAYAVAFAAEGRGRRAPPSFALQRNRLDGLGLSAPR